MWRCNGERMEYRMIETGALEDNDE